VKDNRDLATVLAEITKRKVLFLTPRAGQNIDAFVATSN
jgi:hypothetical protein